MYKIIPIKIKYNSIIKISNKKMFKEKIINVFNYSLKYEEFDENINEKYIQLQNLFCEKQNTGLITEYEKIIITTDVNFHGKKYKMFVYKKNDGVSNYIMHFHHFERDHTLNSLKV